MSKKVILHDGTGEPLGTGMVKVKYEGALANGKVFDSNNNFSFEVGKKMVIPCWETQIATMKKGEVATLTCPAETAYGEAGAGTVIPANAELTFKVTRLE